MNERVEERALQMLIFGAGGLQIHQSQGKTFIGGARADLQSDRCEYKDF